MELNFKVSTLQCWYSLGAWDFGAQPIPSTTMLVATYDTNKIFAYFTNDFEQYASGSVYGEGFPNRKLMIREPVLSFFNIQNSTSRDELVWGTRN